MKFLGLMVAVIAAWLSLSSATAIANTEIKREVDAVIDDVISWRRDDPTYVALTAAGLLAFMLRVVVALRHRLRRTA